PPGPEVLSNRRPAISSRPTPNRLASRPPRPPDAARRAPPLAANSTHCPLDALARLREPNPRALPSPQRRGPIVEPVVALAARPSSRDVAVVPARQSRGRPAALALS